MSLIDACIASVRTQDCDFAVEIIVHDDASTDGSAAHIAARHPDVRLIASRENAGFCVANNRMAGAARGEYLLLLNNDATLLPGALAALMHEARRLQRPAILSLPQYDADTGELLDIGSLLDPFFNAVPNHDPQRQDVGMVAGACLWIPKRLWDELGGFPEWFGSIGEDLYLCCRARLEGHPVRALAVSGYRHGVGASFGGGKVRGGRLSSTFRRRALSERNRTCVMAMTCPGPVAQLLLPLHLALLMIEGVALSLLNRDRAFLTEIYLPVFRALFRQRGLLLQGRRSTLARRKLGVFRFLAVFVATPHKLRMFLRHGLPQVK
ncbi:MAG: glycosyltransferase [Rhodocyclales bacterium]|nr:glycosyltransferase [Rhodocyclales bacterium]